MTLQHRRYTLRFATALFLALVVGQTAGASADGKPKSCSEKRSALQKKASRNGSIPVDVKMTSPWRGGYSWGKAEVGGKSVADLARMSCNEIAALYQAEFGHRRGDRILLPGRDPNRSDSWIVFPAARRHDQQSPESRKPPPMVGVSEERQAAADRSLAQVSSMLDAILGFEDRSESPGDIRFQGERSGRLNNASPAESVAGPMWHGSNTQAVDPTVFDTTTTNASPSRRTDAQAITYFLRDQGDLNQTLDEGAASPPSHGFQRPVDSFLGNLEAVENIQRSAGQLNDAGIAADDLMQGKPRRFIEGFSITARDKALSAASSIAKKAIGSTFAPQNFGNAQSQRVADSTGQAVSNVLEKAGDPTMAGANDRTKSLIPMVADLVRLIKFIERMSKKHIEGQTEAK